MIDDGAGATDGVGALLRPLTARSVLLSVLLGSHPPELPVRSLVKTADLFGISEGSARVALSRLASDGDVVSDGGIYRLSPRLVQRQRSQDMALQPRTRRWTGAWELAVAPPDISPALQRSEFAREMRQLRLAEMRPGVWARPDNLARDWPAPLLEQVWRFSARGHWGGVDPARLAGMLWDLPGWATDADVLERALRSSREAAQRFVIAAAIVRHLRQDPVLPASLRPAGWPAERLRDAYDGYRRELGSLIADRRGL